MEISTSCASACRNCDFDIEIHIRPLYSFALRFNYHMKTPITFPNPSSFLKKKYVWDVPFQIRQFFFSILAFFVRYFLDFFLFCSLFDAWIVMIVAPMLRRFQIQSLGPTVVATLIFEPVLTFKVGLEAFCMKFFDSSLFSF
jgi:hypothetical protein